MSAATMNEMERLRATNEELSAWLDDARESVIAYQIEIKSALEREQALAAKLEHLRQEVPKALRQYRHNNDNSASLFEPKEGFAYGYCKETVDRMLALKPANALTKRDLIKQAEGADIVAKEFEGEYGDYIAMIEQVAERLRQQAAAL